MAVRTSRLKPWRLLLVLSLPVLMLLLGTVTVLGAPGDPGTPSDTLRFDLIIRGGTILDGTGKPGFEGDVGVVGDTIKDVGKIPGNAKAARVIDATGKHVSPGFVDLHTHADGDILADRYLENFVRQGTTTVVGGMCGGGEHPIGAFLEKVNTGNVGPNLAMLIGHGDVRRAVIGMENRLATPEELEKMKEIVKQGMEEGAFGLSSGLFYTPGYFADVQELAALCKVVAAYDGFYTSHVREQSVDVRKSWQEIIDTGKLSGVRVNISHVQVQGASNWGASADLIKMLEDARAQGVKMTGDGYPYDASSTSIVGALVPAWVQAGGYDAMLARLHDPALLPQIRAEIAALVAERGGPHAVLIIRFSRAPELEKKYLDEIMAIWGMADPVDAVIRIVELRNASAIFFSQSQVDKITFYKSPYIAVGSDASGTLVSRLTGGMTHPRAYGTMPGFLARYVRDLGVVSLEEGIRKMTSLPASIAGIADRGVIAKGLKADLTVFDYAKVNDTATYTDPHSFPEGIDAVIINGKAAVENGKHQQILSGRGLYRGEKR